MHSYYKDTPKQPHHDLIWDHHSRPDQELNRNYLYTRDREEIILDRNQLCLVARNERTGSQNPIVQEGIKYCSSTMNDGSEALHFYNGPNSLLTLANTNSGQIIYVSKSTGKLFVNLLDSPQAGGGDIRETKKWSEDNQYGYSSQYNDKQVNGQTQTQKVKDTQKVDVTNKQIFANDTFGRLYAEIERLFLKKGVQINTKYHNYLLNQTASTKECLENIETSLMTIAFYSEYSLRAGVQDHNFADDPVSFENWSEAIKTLIIKLNIEPITVDVIKFVISCCKSKTIKPLPQEYSERIQKQAERDQASNQVFNSRFDDANLMQHKTHEVVGMTHEMIEEAKRGGLDITKFSEVPLLDYRNKNLGYKR